MKKDREKPQPHNATIYTNDSNSVSSGHRRAMRSIWKKQIKLLPTPKSGYEKHCLCEQTSDQALTALPGGA